MPTSTAVSKPSVDLADLSLEELIRLKVGSVYGDARQWQAVADVPSQVTIVTSEEVKLYGYKTLADILRSVPGLYVNYDRNYTYLGLRGFNRSDLNSRVLVMIDGHRINDSLQDAVPLGNDFPLDIDLIDRVEIMQGPGSSIYGNNAFFGVINVISKTGGHYEGGEVSGEIRSFDTYKARFSFGEKFANGVEFLVSGTYFNSAGPGSLYYPEFDSPASNNGYAVGVDGEELYSVFASVSWRGLTLEGAYVDREKSIPTASYRTVFNSSKNRTYDDRAFAALTYEHTFAHDLDLVARLYYDYTGYHGDFLYDVAPAPPPLFAVNQDQFRGDLWGAMVQAVKQFGERYAVTAGTEFRDHFSQDLRNGNVGQPPAFDFETSTWDVGVYAQGEVRLWTNVTINAGLRYDYFETFGDTLNPRAAIIYKPVPATALKFLYGNSYRAPNATELYYNDGGLSTKASPDLQPETIDTYQFVWEQRLPGKVLLGVSAFYYRIDDLITFRLDRNDGLLAYFNLDEAEAAGTQIQLQRTWDWGLRLEGHYSYQNATDAQTGDWLNNSPRHLAGAHAAVPILRDKIFAGVEFQFSSGAMTLSGTETDPFWLVNLTLFSQRLLRNVEFSASLYNVFNQEYSYPGGSEHQQVVIPQDGRAFRLKLTWKF